MTASETANCELTLCQPEQERARIKFRFEGELAVAHAERAAAEVA